MAYGKRGVERGQIHSKAPATLLLALSSVIATLVISVPLGVYSATHHNKAADYIVRVTCFVGNSLPNFFVALLLIYVFALVLGWLPVISPMPTLSASGVDLTGLVLPTATLAPCAYEQTGVRGPVLRDAREPGDSRAGKGGTRISA